MRLVTALRRLGRVRPTSRGVGACLVGTALALVGLALALPDLVGVGAAALLAVALAWLVTGLQRLEEGRGALVVRRRATPSPVVRDARTEVRLSVSAAAPTGAAYERLSRLRLSEQAAHELAGHEGIRARVHARPERIDVVYALTPSRRGRWPLGPLLTSRTDVFGLVRATQPLGGTTAVPVWPRTTELVVRTRTLGDVDRASAGGRLQSSDDAVLREYVPGDDPRRVHWASAARRGQLLVRADESAGVRPVSVLLDRGLLPHQQDNGTAFSRPAAVADGEWAVDLTASLATSFLDAGHPARILATSTAPAVEGERFVPTRASRHLLLDACVDLHGHRGAGEAEQAAGATARALRLARRPSELLVAVIGPQGPDTRRELAALGADGSCWALVVTPHGKGPGHDAEDTVAELTAAGWRVARCAARTEIERAWALLTEEAA
ncbi:DUF58 domain-containing protein [Myceligenerans crystallogenes]|uniref:DUF58 domain-containing protein n=1 Tax=Myceligenerans crystallogenes TaxID=316335 RepID=A0ABN2NKA0_9MICO